MYFFWLLFLFSLGKYSVVKLLGRIEVLFLIFWGTSITVFHSGCTHSQSHQPCTRVPFSLHPHQCLFVALLMIMILKYVRWCRTVVLVCVSLIISDIERLLMCLLAVCISSLQKCLFRSPAHSLIGCLFVAATELCVFLYILDVNPLLDILFANIFSHLAGCFFGCWEFPSLCKSFLVLYSPIYFCFCFPCLRRHSQKILLKLMLKSVVLKFSSRSFIVSGLTFKSLIHFEFIFVYGVRK